MFVSSHKLVIKFDFLNNVLAFLILDHNLSFFFSFFLVRYDSSKAFSQNVELTDPIVSRFDVLCVVKVFV